MVSSGFDTRYNKENTSRSFGPVESWNVRGWKRHCGHEPADIRWMSEMTRSIEGGSALRKER